MRIYYLRCEDFTCGATFVADMEITQQLSPSGIPNNEVVGQLERISQRRGERSSQVEPEQLPFRGVDHAPENEQRISPGTKRGSKKVEYFASLKSLP